MAQAAGKGGARRGRGKGGQPFATYIVGQVEITASCLRMLHTLQVTDAANVITAVVVVGVETTVVAIHVPPAPFYMQQLQLTLRFLQL